jgi:Tol biopolymer transport system component
VKKIAKKGTNMRVVAVAVTMALCLGVMTCKGGTTAPDGTGTKGGETGRIVFTSTRDGHPQIYSVDPDGSHVTRLSVSTSDDDFPLWSPAGNHISFLSNRSGNWDLWIMEADGSRPRRLTDTPSADEHSPAWSPTGDTIAFATDRDAGDWEVYVVDAAGKSPRNLTHSPGLDYSPNWSPDGRRIAFVSERDGNAEIYVMDADGSHQRRLTTDPKRESLGTAAWSPDGRKLVYMAGIDGQIEIMVRDVEGGGERQLTKQNAPVWNPASPVPPVFVSAGWSPNGSAILYVSGRDGRSELKTMNPDGARTATLLPRTAEYSDYAPNWGAVARPGRAD